MIKRISVWGATGSIGRQTLDVVDRNKGRFKVVTLTTHRNAALLFTQAEKFRPRRVVITGEVDRREWEDRFNGLGVALLWGKEGLLEAAGSGDEDLVINALVGSVGLEATMRAVQANTSIALANKEVLVMAGELVTAEISKRGLSLIPIDSEHSAVFQCLRGESAEWVRRIILTASGGPFLNRSRVELNRVTVDEALAHPNWSMGKKVTIDSATLMNKGLEVIEARWLFGMEPDRVEVVIHPQSVIHSMVEFADGSIKAQMGVPDMRIPILYALTYPERWAGEYGRMDFTRAHELTFFPPDMERFPALDLAYEALRRGGTASAVLNGADEVAVDLFLRGRIGFLQIPEIIRKAMDLHDIIPDPAIEDILEADRWTREIVLSEIVPSL